MIHQCDMRLDMGPGGWLPNVHEVSCCMELCSSMRCLPKFKLHICICIQLRQTSGRRCLLPHDFMFAA